MTEKSRSREEGIALLSALALVLVIMGLIGALAAVSTLSLRTHAFTDRLVRAFYVADSGTQAGHLLLTSTNGSVAPVEFTESLSGGSVDVAIERVGLDYFRVASTGVYEGVTREVEAHYELENSFSLEAAVEFMFSDSVEVEATELSARLSDMSSISGFDHMPDGTIALDQSDARPGIALGPIPGDVDMVAHQSLTSSLVGVPEAIVSTDQDNRQTLQALRTHVRREASLTTVGSRTVGTAANGFLGTEATPVMTHVVLGADESLHFTEDFEGYGTLIVEVGKTETASALRFSGNAKWHGLVVVQFRAESEVDGGSLISLEDDSEIRGGIAIDFRGDEIEVEGIGDLLRLSGTSKVRYSSTLVENAPGLAALGLGGVLKLVSYRIL